MNDELIRRAAALAECERVIERGLKTFIEVGEALAQIRDERLYRETHATFEEYCRERWDFDASRARQLISAARTVTLVTVGGQPAPASERVVRELRRAGDKAPVVWAETVKEHGAAATAKQACLVRDRVLAETPDRPGLRLVADDSALEREPHNPASRRIVSNIERATMLLRTAGYLSAEELQEIRVAFAELGSVLDARPLGLTGSE
jgi:hypothetical protein